MSLLIDFPFSDFCLLVLEADAQLSSRYRSDGAALHTRHLHLDATPLYHLTRRGHPRSPHGFARPSRHPSWSVQRQTFFTLPPSFSFLFRPLPPQSSLHRRPTLPHFLFLLSTGLAVTTNVTSAVSYRLRHSARAAGSTWAPRFLSNARTLFERRKSLSRCLRAGEISSAAIPRRDETPAECRAICTPDIARKT